MLSLESLFIYAINNWKKQVYEHKHQFLRLHCRQFHCFLPRRSEQAQRAVFLHADVPPGLMEAAHTFVCHQTSSWTTILKAVVQFLKISTLSSTSIGLNLKEEFLFYFVFNALNILSNVGGMEQFGNALCLCCSVPFADSRVQPGCADNNIWLIENYCSSDLQVSSCNVKSLNGKYKNNLVLRS